MLPLIRRDTPKPTEYATAFVEVNSAAVHAAAEASTARWKAGKARGLLDGVPIAVKDELDVEGYLRKMGSNEVFETKGTSWCAKVLMESGAIVMGKATMHELGLGEQAVHTRRSTSVQPSKNLVRVT